MNSYGGSSYPELMLQRLRDPAEALAAVRQWVEQAQVEDLYLDFTRKDSPDNGALEANDKRGYAKALSGFANSDGGLLVWGVAAEKDKHDPQSADAAKCLEPISPLDVFLGELNSILYHSTKPSVSGVENIPVPESSHSSRGYVVTYVPAGTNPPYRAEKGNNNHYYKRAGSSFYPMEPYDIRDVVFRFRYPKVDLTMDYKLTTDTQDLHVYSLVLSITNHGPSALREYKVVLEFPQGYVNTQGLMWRRDGEARRGAHVFEKFAADVASSPPAIIYPGETFLLSRGGPYPMSYRVTRAPSAADGPVRCTLYGVDMPPLVVEKPFTDMQEF